ncbi:fasciclin domain-containing protein [Flammeovirga pectinis]|uniref:Fasciclin domain-containing protein n=1 Tax=Flammeovirga pectinis TaxID=2494373 RepID=A0A3Q9FIW6_9BACT|nr:fasciclin domain-containing protein [Flammeovirga pectinis]AZQ60847.1 fasciclin domain-containing protein [Flammeovirga pectinis]
MDYLRRNFLFFSFVGMFFSCGNISSDSNQNEVVKEQVQAKGQSSVVDEVSDPNILQVALGSKDHTTLVVAVQAAGIEDVLVNAGPITVFAPVNAAFAALPDGTVESLILPKNKGKLTEVLTHHAAPGTYNKKQLKKNAKKGRKIYTANNDYLDVEVKDEEIYIGGAKVLGEVATSNGYIIVIDKVLLP